MKKRSVNVRPSVIEEISRFRGPEPDTGIEVIRMPEAGNSLFDKHELIQRHEARLTELSRDHEAKLMDLGAAHEREFGELQRTLASIQEEADAMRTRIRESRRSIDRLYMSLLAAVLFCAYFAFRDVGCPVWTGTTPAHVGHEIVRPLHGRAAAR